MYYDTPAWIIRTYPCVLCYGCAIGHKPTVEAQSHIGKNRSVYECTRRLIEDYEWDTFVFSKYKCTHHGIDLWEDSRKDWILRQEIQISSYVEDTLRGRALHLTRGVSLEQVECNCAFLGERYTQSNAQESTSSSQPWALSVSPYVKRLFPVFCDTLNLSCGREINH